MSNARLSRLAPGNVVRWQEVDHRVCGRELLDHRVQLALAPKSEDGKFYEHLVFLTRPIAASISVRFVDRHAKIRQRRDDDEDSD